MIALEEHRERVADLLALKPRERRELYLQVAGYSYRDIARMTASSYTPDACVATAFPSGAVVEDMSPKRRARWLPQGARRAHYCTIRVGWPRPFR